MVAIAYRHNPCMECQERHRGCHAECEKYKNFRKEVDEYAEAKRKFKREKGLDFTW